MFLFCLLPSLLAILAPTTKIIIFRHQLEKIRTQTKRYEGANNLLRMSFALLFILVRVLYWPVIAGRHLWDTVGSVQVGVCARFAFLTSASCAAVVSFRVLPCSSIEDSSWP